MITKTDSIILSIENKIETGTLKPGEQLPSLNLVMQEFGVSRDTTIKAYKDLLSRGILYSLPGKGYYVSDSRTGLRKNILLLFDALSDYKNTLVRSIERSLEPYKTQYNIYFHHYNTGMFRQLIEANLNRYTHYVIMPFPGYEEIVQALQLIPGEKLILLDRHDGIQYKARFVGQEYASDIEQSLASARERFSKYRLFRFVFPQPSFHPVELQKGFALYCRKAGIEYEIISPQQIRQVQPGEAYLVIDDEDLVEIIQSARQKDLQIGEQIGIISYNETPLKSVVANGITTVSTDFALMGQHLVKMIYDSSIGYIHNPAELILRNSF
jgi:DNA-binding transcriptional regulator YhcF (GntR family)